MESVECYNYNWRLGEISSFGYNVCFKLEDGTKFTEHINEESILVPVDTSSIGKKYTKFKFKGIEFEAQYIVSL